MKTRTNPHPSSPLDAGTAQPDSPPLKRRGVWLRGAVPTDVPAPEEAGHQSSFTIVTVCTGNVCRSPLAHVLLQRWAGGMLPADVADAVTVASAGTGAPVGAAMSQHSQTLAAQLGADGSAHRAAQITPAHLRVADLVLVATRSHRKQVVSLLPRAVRYTYTIREFGRLATAAQTAEGLVRVPQTPADIHANLAIVAAKRGRIPAATPRDDDIIDPIGQPFAVYEQMASELVDPLRAGARVLFGG